MHFAKLLRIALAGSALFMGAFPRFASAGTSFSENKRVACSTNTATPSLVSLAGSYSFTSIKAGGTNYILLGDANTSFSKSTSTGTARISSERLFLDSYGGVFDSAYGGAIYCVGEDTVNNVIDVLRLK